MIRKTQFLVDRMVISDPAHKIRPVLDLINNTCSHHYGLGRDVTVDESIVGFKGRNSLVQYMPAIKAHRGGLSFSF